MGGEESKLDPNIKNQQQEQNKMAIQNNLSLGRLKLDHQSNIYAKFEYLNTHYELYSDKFEQLYLNHNMISIELMTLLSRTNISNLKTLSLGNNDINCQSLKPIKSMPLRTLLYLFLDHNLIANDGCYYLTQTNLQSLLTLDLNNNLIQDDGCKNLARANLPNLRTLLICHNKLKEKGLVYLSKGQWPLLAFAQAKSNSFQPNKQLQALKFRSEVKVFRLQIQ